MTGVVVGTERLTPAQIMARIESGERVVILVGDRDNPAGDPIPRLVDAAFPSDVPNGHTDPVTGRPEMTTGRWTIYFGGPYRSPGGIITTATYRWTVTDRAPAPELPIPVFKRAAPAVRVESPEDIARKARQHAAHEAGVVAGGRHAAWCEAYAPADTDDIPDVPQEYSDVASWWLSGYADGVEAHDDDQED